MSAEHPLRAFIASSPAASSGREPILKRLPPHPFSGKIADFPPTLDKMIPFVESGSFCLGKFSILVGLLWPLIAAIDLQKHLNFVIGKSPLSRGLGSGLHIGDRIGLAVMKVGRDVVRRRDLTSWPEDCIK